MTQENELQYIYVDGNKEKHCPYWECRADKNINLSTFCSVTLQECRYGLTEIRVPESCPLKIKPIIRVVGLKPKTTEKSEGE